MKPPYKTETSAGLPILIIPNAREAGMLEGSLKNYIAETWRKSMQRDPLYKHQVGLTRERIWSRIERILASPLTTVTLAAWPETAAEGELFVVGWLVYGSNTIHYAYVRERYRDAGVVKALFDVAAVQSDYPPVPCSHWSATLPANGKLKHSLVQFAYAGLDWAPEKSPEVEYVK